MSPYQIVNEAVEDARHICLRQYGDAPDIKMFGSEHLQCAYVPDHLHHMIFELVKNSLRAVSDRYMDSDEEPPAIKIGTEAKRVEIAVLYCGSSLGANFWTKPQRCGVFFFFSLEKTVWADRSVFFFLSILASDC